jgi:hypothetical protein
MLNAHRDVVIPPESRFITQLWDERDEIDTKTFLETLARHKRFQIWELPIESVEKKLQKPKVAYTEAIAGVYEAYAETKNKIRWGDKTPRYVLEIPKLAKLFPDARFIHLIRDGRNVALSYAEVPFGPKNITRAAALWAERVGAGCESGRVLPPGRYIEIRYEDLVEDPQGEARDICEFLSLEFDPGMLEYTERARNQMLDRAAKYNPHLTEPPTQTRSWETDMPADQIEIFEAVAGDVLSLLGYERRFQHPSRAAQIKARLGQVGLPVGRFKK